MKEIGFFERYGLTRVINVSGTMTALGASRVVPEAIRAGADIQSHFVRIDELQAKASEVICTHDWSGSGICRCMQRCRNKPEHIRMYDGNEP